MSIFPRGGGLALSGRIHGPFALLRGLREFGVEISRKDVKAAKKTQSEFLPFTFYLLPFTLLSLLFCISEE